MSPEIEIPIKASEARKILGLGASFFSAVKSRMGLKNRKRVLLSHVRRWLRDNPEFRETDVYHRAGCVCAECKKKRAARQDHNVLQVT